VNNPLAVALDDKSTLSVKFFVRNPVTKTKNDLPTGMRRAP
jgi:hypothetical protein